MKYSELEIDIARKICRRLKKNCDKCPLRREREYCEKGEKKTRTLFCYFILRDLYCDLQVELDELNNEEIKYIDDTEKLINSFETVE